MAARIPPTSTACTRYLARVVEGDDVIDQIRGNDEITKIVVKDEE